MFPFYHIFRRFSTVITIHTAKADPLATKWLLGHSTKSDITEHYTHETIAVLKEAISLMA